MGLGEAIGLAVGIIAGMFALLFVLAAVEEGMFATVMIDAEPEVAPPGGGEPEPLQQVA